MIEAIGESIRHPFIRQQHVPREDGKLRHDGGAQEPEP